MDTFENLSEESPNTGSDNLPFQSRIDISKLNAALKDIRRELEKVIIGQVHNIEFMLIGMLCGGHVLLEGVPGVAKTLMAKLLARSVNGSFKRIQFTPDLMPSDILGTSVFNPKSLEFEYKAGPIFANILLIDEVNRSPAKTQAALFELMEEKQVTIDGVTRKMEEPFFVIATQNPLEQEGTYRLPEAQLDRFLLKLTVTYPEVQEEFDLLQRFNLNTQHELTETITPILSSELINELKQTIQNIKIEPNLLKFIATVTHSTRNHSLIELGASPRASLALMQASKAMAAVSGRDFVIPEDIKTMALPVLRHRMILTAEAEMEGARADDILTTLFNTIEVPR